MMNTSVIPRTLQNSKMNEVLKYRNLIILSIILFVSIYIAYTISKSYKISKILYDMKPIDDYVIVTSKLNKERDLKLCDFYIASAFRPYMGNNQFFNYIDLSITEKIITNGVRSIYVDIFNDNMGIEANPVISSGIKEGQWKLSLNTVPFEDLCKLISTICFNAGYVNNFEDPFILMLNLNVNGNLTCLNKIRNNIYTHLRRYLLSNKYTYGKVNIGQVPIKYLKRKLLIFTSNGYQHSDLEEFVNYSWNKESLKKISYESLDPNTFNSDVIKIDGQTFKNYNKNNLTIVTPIESVSITDLYTKNYNPTYFWETGCQIVCMNYQLLDEHFDTYISKFKNDSFISKPNLLQGASIKEKVVIQETELSKKMKTIDMDNDGQRCPEAPSEDYLSGSEIITYKDNNSRHGLCFITSNEKECNCSGEDCLNKELYNDELLDESSKYKLCCSNKKINDPYINNNKHYLSQLGDNIQTKQNLDINIEGNDNFKHLNLYRLAELSDENPNSIENKNICLIDKHLEPPRCPNDWEKSGNLSNGYSICCRNT